MRSPASMFGVQALVLGLGAIVVGVLMVRAVSGFGGSGSSPSPVVSTGDVQSIEMTLDYPYYEPELIQVQKGRTVALTISSIDPG